MKLHVSALTASTSLFSQPSALGKAAGAGRSTLARHGAPPGLTNLALHVASRVAEGIPVEKVVCVGVHPHGGMQRRPVQRPSARDASAQKRYKIVNRLVDEVVQQRYQPRLLIIQEAGSEWFAFYVTTESLFPIYSVAVLLSHNASPSPTA